MSERPDTGGSAERAKNLWAPWRMEYIDALNDDKGGCFLCRYRDEPTKDSGNFVLWRGKLAFAVMNRFPYTGGHCLVAPYAHEAGLSDVGSEAMMEMFGLLGDLQRTMERALRAEGFNIGMNIGRCAGAGLPGHLHIHIVPRWPGDTNFMPVFGGVRVIPQTLEAIRLRILEAAAELGLRRP